MKANLKERQEGISEFGTTSYVQFDTFLTHLSMFDCYAELFRCFYFKRLYQASDTTWGHISCTKSWQAVVASGREAILAWQTRTILSESFSNI